MKAGQVIFEGKTSKGLEVILRYPKPSDLESLLTYINALSKEKTFIHFQGEKITKRQEEIYLSAILKKIEKDADIQILAFNKSTLLGKLNITPGSLNEDHVGVLGITVSKQARSLGLGYLLMENGLKEAKRLRGLKTLTLKVYGPNLKAQKLYRQFGFKKYGNLPGGAIYRGRPVDVILMFKPLDKP